MLTSAAQRGWGRCQASTALLRLASGAQGGSCQLSSRASCYPAPGAPAVTKTSGNLGKVWGAEHVEGVLRNHPAPIIVGPGRSVLVSRSVLVRNLVSRMVSKTILHRPGRQLISLLPKPAPQNRYPSPLSPFISFCRLRAREAGEGGILRGLGHAMHRME